jgi:hypothetical protein
MKPQLLKQIQPHLQKGETIQSTIYGTYEIKIMKKDSIRNGNLIATDQRVLFYAKKLFGYELESFPLKNISSIEKSKGIMGHSITFFASGNKCKMKWIKSGEISKFTEYVNSKIGSTNTKQIQKEESIPELIKKLHKLKEEGILSEEEFNSKKTEMLKKI